MERQLEDLVHVEIKVGEHRDDEDDEEDVYGAFTVIEAKFYFLGGAKNNPQQRREIGSISGIAINRQKVPEHCFVQALDEYSSGKMEWVAGDLLENVFGRTTLQSLRDGGDDQEFDFFLLDSFHLDDDWYRGHKRVSSSALPVMWRHLPCESFYIVIPSRGT
jgi:hypothetical protein